MFMYDINDMRQVWLDNMKYSSYQATSGKNPTKHDKTFILSNLPMLRKCYEKLEN